MIQTELTKHEIARVFAMYYGCMATTNHPNYKTVINYAACNDSAYVYSEKDGWDSLHIKSNEVKLILTPLSKITNERDMKEIIKLTGKLTPWFSIISTKANISKEGLFLDIDYVFINSVGYESYSECNLQLSNLPSTIHQYLIQKEYAVPLFFGINHPANGKTAIELGIAIDKTQIGYPNPSNKQL